MANTEFPMKKAREFDLQGRLVAPLDIGHSLLAIGY
jgi:hypothetical protein